MRLTHTFSKNQMNQDPTSASSGLRHRQPVSHSRGAILLVLLLVFVAGNAGAMDITEWRFRTSLYTKHWNPDPEHVNHSKLLNIEFVTGERWLYGFAHFDNSFGQPSQYLYAGYSWPVLGKDWAYFQLTGGILHGYKEPYKDKIPLNNLGVAPAIIPSLGLRYKRVFTELQVLGTAAITVTAGFSFGHNSD